VGTQHEQPTSKAFGRRCMGSIVLAAQDV